MQAVQPVKAPEPAELQALIEAALAGRDIAIALLGPVERRVLRRCALARRFNEALYVRVLRPAAKVEIQDYPFARIATLPGVRANPGRPGWYSLEPSQREVCLQDWLATTPPADDAEASPAIFRRLNRRLAAWFKCQGGDGELEVLYHRLAGPSFAAEAAWRKAYAASRDRFDLARCESMLSLLGERARFVSPALASFMTQERGLLAARGAFADDYFRTGRYLERKQLLTDFESLLGNDPRSIMVLHAPGGSGKTMFLRWLAARYCLPRGVPMARVDFDFLDESEQDLAPAFFIGKLAERLNAQLPGAPFFELLRTLAELRRQATSRLAEGHSAIGGDSARSLEHEVAERFAATLVEYCAGRPVVLVFDTLEDAALKHRVNVRGVVGAIDEVRAQLEQKAAASGRAPPRLILILSGRYTLEEQYPEVQQDFGGRVLPSEVARFDDLESRDYLQRRLTGIATQPKAEVIDGVIERANGSPFKLSLYADILLATPNIEVEDLGRGVDVDMLYLIERVMKRIADRRIYLLLRYGVLARRLTRNFVENVLGKPMRLAARGDRRADDPAEDAVTHKDWKLLWSSMEPLDYEQMWKGLRDFAGASSWVSIDTEIGDSVVIQPVVSHPMRRALLSRERPVVAQIHRAAIRQAQKELGNASRPAAESLAMLTYHDFQLRGPLAAPAWERRLDEYAGDFRALRSLASVVLSEDLRESEAEPVERGGASRLVSLRVAARARFVLAQTALDESQGASEKELQAKRLDEARVQLAHYDELVDPQARPVPLAVEGRLRLALATDEPHAIRALEQMKAALATRLSGDERAQLLLELERGYARRDPALARSFGIAWGQVAWRRGDAESYAESVVASITHKIQQGRRAAALRECLENMEALSPSNPRWGEADDARDARRLLAREQPVLEAWCGLLHAAILRRGRALEKPDRFTDDAAELVRIAALHSWAGDARAAIRFAEEAQKRIKERLRAVRLKLDAARRLESLRLEGIAARAHASRRLMDFGAALDLHQEAMELHAQRSDHQSEVLARLQKARVYLLDLGHLRQAAEHLIDSADALADEVVRVRIEHTLLRAVLHDRRGDAVRAREILGEAEKLLPQLQQNALNWQVELSVAGLALHLEDDRVVFLEALRQGLAKLDCAGARLTLLRGLRYAIPVADVPRALGESLEELTRVEPVGLPGYMALHAPDRIRFVLLRAELLRTVGFGDAAVRELKGLRLSRTGEDAQAELWHRDMAKACDRLGIDPAEVLPAKWLAAFIAKYRSYRMLCAAAQIEQAARDLRSGVTPSAVKLLRSAQSSLDRPDTLRSELDIRALTLQARLARGGADAWGESSAAELLGRAQRIRTELGLPEVRVEEAPAKAVTVPPHVAPQDDNLVGSFTFGMHFETPEKVSFFAFDADHPPHEQETYRVRSPISGMLAEFASGRFGEGAAHEAVALSSEPRLRFGRLMAESVLPPRLREAPALDVVVECAQPGMHALPWELMVHDIEGRMPMVMEPRVGQMWRAPYRATPRDRVAWVQRALGSLLGTRLVADGIYGPATAGLLRQFQSNEGVDADGRLDGQTLHRLHTRMAERNAANSNLRRSRDVLLIMPRTEVEVATQRGFSASGTHLGMLYADAGLQCESLDEPNLPWMRELLGRHPSVIHIATPIAQSRTSRELTLQFAAGYESSGTTALGASMLARLIGDRPPELGMPLVIVDTPRPHSRDEAFRQLLLRNAFAAQLFAYGPLHTVIATGLGLPDEQRMLSQCLTRTIAEWPSPGELVHRLRQAASADGQVEDEAGWPLASAGIALFAIDPAFDPLLLGARR